MNLAETYAAVCAKRPDLAVEGLRRLVGYWYRGSMCEVENTAASLILARWVEALPQYTWLGHDGDPLNGWKVRGLSDGDNYEIIIVMIDAKPTPLEALAAYYLGETA